MKTDRQLIEQLLEWQEHPNHLTIEQFTIEQIDDPQMRELVEQMAFAKRAFKNEELQAEEPDVEGEWEKFAAKHLIEERDKAFGGESETRKSHRMRKIAASFIGILLVSGIAYAAIRFVRMTDNRKPQIAQTEQPVSPQSPIALPADTVMTDTTATLQPIVFDNVPLDTLLAEIAAYYDAEVSFQNNTTRQLRFHFVWRREDSLEHAIKKLNRFESLSVRLDKNKIIVE
jgi:ferric-dicitrate binding protein FerR (iron transport regulator)